MFHPMDESKDYFSCMILLAFALGECEKRNWLERFLQFSEEGRLAVRKLVEEALTDSNYPMTFLQRVLRRRYREYSDYLHPREANAS